MGCDASTGKVNKTRSLSKKVDSKTKQHARLIWTNFNIGQQLLNYFTEREKIEFQGLNQFCYEKYIGKV